MSQEGQLGGEIHPKQVKRTLEKLIERGLVRFEGSKRWAIDPHRVRGKHA